MTARVLHVVPGPPEHGVVWHAIGVARACGDEALRVDADDLPALPACDVVHVPVTERLFGRDLDRAAAGFARLADAARGVGAALSVTLHDLPYDDSDFQRRRAGFYRQVVGAARGVVVNSDVELDLVTPWATVHSLRRIRLPVERVASSVAAPVDGRAEVTVLGFVFPDRGYEDVIAALPDDATLLALGRASAGHDDLLPRYFELSGGRFRSTGFVADTDLAGYLRAAAVPIAPNRRVTASASINTWLAHGRRPLVPDGPYARELAALRPGAVWIYDPADPVELRAALASALRDPGQTWLPPDVALNPSWTQVGAAYRAHLQACRPPRAQPLPVRSMPVRSMPVRSMPVRSLPVRSLLSSADRSATYPSDVHIVPGNRWDLLPSTSGRVAARPSRCPTVSVVVPYFEAQHQLDLVLTALSGQTYPSERIEVLVVDDGSIHPPDVSMAGALAVRVLRQPDEGFRAARARNVGAAAASGELLAFLDGDTVPEPNYLAALLALPTVCPDAVTVGRRRHADLAAVSPQSLPAFWSGELPVTQFTEPQWLADAYRRSDDLLRVDRRSYRYLISAVLALPATLFAEVGGFDERFVGYGGEDWELAHRLYCAGAVFAHVPSAVAWHDGPDWAERGGDVASKTAETLTLAALLPDPVARGAGSWWPYASIVVRAPAMSDVEALATARSAFGAGVDCVLHLADVIGPRADLVLADPRVRVGPLPDGVLARASCVLDLDGPTDLSGITTLADEVDRLGEIRTPALRARSSRAVRRAARWSAGLADGDVEAFAHELFGIHDRGRPGLSTDGDLAARLAALSPR